MSERVEGFFTFIAVGFEVIGALAMVVGFVIALVLAARGLRRREGGRPARAWRSSSRPTSSARSPPSPRSRMP